MLLLLPLSLMCSAVYCRFSCGYTDGIDGTLKGGRWKYLRESDIAKIIRKEFVRDLEKLAKDIVPTINVSNDPLNLQIDGSNAMNCLICLNSKSSNGLFT